MKKLDDLRKTLLASVAQLRDDPSKMEIFVDRGDVTVRPGSLSFEYSYAASIWVQDFAGDPDTLLVPLIAWVAANQPDLFQSGEARPFSFESELLDADTCDISITINLTELVRVERLPAGLKVNHLEEPRLVDAFEGVPDGTRLWSGVLDDLIAGTADIVPNGDELG